MEAIGAALVGVFTAQELAKGAPGHAEMSDRQDGKRKGGAAVKGILLPVHPQWAAMIYAGVKRYELRKNEPRDKEFLRQIDKPIYIYETGIGLVTGMCAFEAARGCEMATEASFYSRVPTERVLQYGPGRDDKYHVWLVSGAGRFSTPLPVSLFGISRAPQSWCYVEVGAPDPFESEEVF